MDKLFRVEVIAKTLNPQQVIYSAMHQDYSESFVYDDRDRFPSEEQCGEIIVKRLLAGDRGHFGCTEHPQIVFNCGYFPHSVMQQARTHRTGVSFDVQSYRYTGIQVIDVVDGRKDIEDVFYLRPVGNYSDRTGKKYYYSPEQRESDLQWCLEAAKRYKADFEAGMSEEHARGKVPFDYRQHFVVSFNLRSLLHFLDLRCKKDAQLEIQQLCELMLPHLESWTPAIALWYKQNRLGKARLSP
jgi:thymidylate synthase (FAD)